MCGPSASFETDTDEAVQEIDANDVGRTFRDGQLIYFVQADGIFVVNPSILGDDIAESQVYFSVADLEASNAVELTAPAPAAPVIQEEPEPVKFRVFQDRSGYTILHNGQQAYYTNTHRPADVPVVSDIDPDGLLRLGYVELTARSDSLIPF